MQRLSVDVIHADHPSVWRHLHLLVTFVLIGSLFRLIFFHSWDWLIQPAKYLYLYCFLVLVCFFSIGSLIDPNQLQIKDQVSSSPKQLLGWKERNCQEAHVTTAKAGALIPKIDLKKQIVSTLKEQPKVHPIAKPFPKVYHWKQKYSIIPNEIPDKKLINRPEMSFKRFQKALSSIQPTDRDPKSAMLMVAVVTLAVVFIAMLFYRRSRRVFDQSGHQPGVETATAKAKQPNKRREETPKRTTRESRHKTGRARRWSSSSTD